MGVPAVDKMYIVPWEFHGYSTARGGGGPTDGGGGSLDAGGDGGQDDGGDGGQADGGARRPPNVPR